MRPAVNRRLASLAGAVSLLSCAGCEIMTVPVMKTVMAVDAVASNGRFVIRGDVVDDGGAPLHGVTMTVEATKFLGFDFDPPDGSGIETKTRKKRWVKHVNGSFAVRTGRYSDLKLDFSKPGHESRRLTFTVDADVPATQTAGS